MTGRIGDRRTAGQTQQTEQRYLITVKVCTGIRIHCSIGQMIGRVGFRGAQMGKNMFTAASGRELLACTPVFVSCLHRGQTIRHVDVCSEKSRRYREGGQGSSHNGKTSVSASMAGMLGALGIFGKQASAASKEDAEVAALLKEADAMYAAGKVTAGTVHAHAHALWLEAHFFP